MTKYCIIGNGVAGTTAAQGLVAADPAAEVNLLGEESYPYYYRPRLWEFLTGGIEQSSLFFRPAEWYAAQKIQLHLGTRASAIDPAEHLVTLETGKTLPFDRLLLATGSRPFIPPLDGVGKTGVFTLYTLDHAIAIRAYAAGCRCAVVVGGGLLGLETARALSTQDLEVTVLEIAPHLLPRQLDPEGSQVFCARLQSTGLRIITDAKLAFVLGKNIVTGIQLKDGRRISTDLVLFSTGIIPRTELAHTSGLAINRGIVVDQRLRTSAEDIFAIGDASEFEHAVYGLTQPAIEQAITVSKTMAGDSNARYHGSLPAATLKIAGIELTSLGEATATGNPYDILRMSDEAKGPYQKIVLRGGRIVGAILLDENRKVQPLKQLIASQRDVSAYLDHLLSEEFDLRALAKNQL